MASNCSSNEPTEGLCPGDLKVVYEELFEIRAKWRRLGLKLDLTSGTLDAIQQRYLDPEDRLERTLLEWLNKGSATWRQIVKALFSCVVGETRLSQKLEEKYCQKGKNRKRKHESDSDEEVEQLDSEIKLMVKKFASLERDTRESMKKRKVSPKSLVAEIVSYRTFAAVLKKEDRLLADRQEDLEKATCIDEIFVIVSPFWSFLDFMILEHIINELGDDCDRQNLAVYITCLTDFLNSWKIEPIKVCRLEIGSQEKLHFKLKTSSLSMYRDVKAAIARILGVNSLALQLHSVKDGCVELVFLFPKLATHELLPLSPSVSSMLSEVNPQIQKISLVDDNTTETVIFKAIAPASLLDFEIHFEVFYQKLDVLKILPYLRAGAMLTGDIFYKLRSIPDDQEKRHYLCTHLLHRCRYLGFSQFAYCLVWSGQTALAKDIGIDVDAVPSCPYDDSWIHNELDFLLSFGCIKRSQLQTSLVFRWNRGKSVKKPMPIKMGLTVKSIIIDEVL